MLHDNDTRYDNDEDHWVQHVTTDQLSLNLSTIILSAITHHKFLLHAFTAFKSSTSPALFPQWYTQTSTNQKKQEKPSQSICWMRTIIYKHYHIHHCFVIFVQKTETIVPETMKYTGAWIDQFDSRLRNLQNKDKDISGGYLQTLDFYIKKFHFNLQFNDALEHKTVKTRMST